jgi:Secretion system C-terminal sorting domain
MKKIYFVRHLFLCISILVIYNNSKSQTLQTPCAASSQGTIGSSGSIVINYTIGEMVLVDNYKSNGLFISQGIMQPDVPNGIVNYSAFTSGDIIVYPNPTPNDLSIQISILKKGKMELQVYDALGQVLIKDAFDVNGFMLQKYNLTKYANATYVLKLRFKSNDGVMDKQGTYKIVKG